jgi:transcription initiation factor TFIID subunit 12
MAESFVIEVAQSSATLARHRHSHTIEPKDIQLYLEREYDMGLSGFVEQDEKTAPKAVQPTVGHQTRSAHATRAANSVQR